MAAKVVFIHGDKGGVGKTTACTAYTEKAISEGRNPIVIDSDPRNPDVMDRFQGSLECQQLVLLDHSGWIELASIIAKNPGRDVIVSMSALMGLMSDEFSFISKALKKSGHSLVIAWVMNRSTESVTLLRDFALATKTVDRKIVAIRNGFFGDNDKFRRWENADFRSSMLAAGHADVYLPELHEMVIDELPIDRPYSEALKSEDVDFGIQLELESWLSQAFEALQAVDEGVAKKTEAA